VSSCKKCGTFPEKRKKFENLGSRKLYAHEESDMSYD